MKRKAHEGMLVAEVRKLIRKSQSQFAAMIGVSKHTIISVENGRNRLSKSLAEKIHVATGADLEPRSLKSPVKKGHFTLERFNRWRNSFYPSTEESARQRLEEYAMWLKVVLLAAAKPGRAGNRDRLPAVCLSLTEWMKDTCKNFKLQDEILHLLPEETRHVAMRAHTISALLEDSKEGRKELADHDVDFDSIRSELEKNTEGGLLLIEDEHWCAWPPTCHVTFPVDTRKLIPKAKCWIRKFDPTKPLTNIGHLLRPHEPSEPLLKTRPVRK